MNYDEGDRVWCVFDVDKNSNDALEAAFEAASIERVEISLSNPCIELWFLLHYIQRNASISKEEALRELIRNIPNYQKGKPIAGEIKAGEHDAIVRAKVLDRQHKRNGYCANKKECNPSSHMFTLVEFIYKVQEKNEK